MKFQAKIFFSQVGLQNYSVKFLLTGQCNPMTLLPLLVTPENSLPIPVLVWSLYWSWKVSPAYITWQSSSFSLGVSVGSSLHTKPFPDWLCDKKHFSLFLGAWFSTVLTKNIPNVILSYKSNSHRCIIFNKYLVSCFFKFYLEHVWKNPIVRLSKYSSPNLSSLILQEFLQGFYCGPCCIYTYLVKNIYQNCTILVTLSCMNWNTNLNLSIIFIGLNLVNFYIYYSLFASSKYFEV